MLFQILLYHFSSVRFLERREWQYPSGFAVDVVNHVILVLASFLSQPTSCLFVFLSKLMYLFNKGETVPVVKMRGKSI